MVRLMREHQQYPLISVVIPALNEAQNLQYVLPYIPPLVSEIIPTIFGISTDNYRDIVYCLRHLPFISLGNLHDECHTGQ